MTSAATSSAPWMPAFYAAPRRDGCTPGALGGAPKWPPIEALIALKFAIGVETIAAWPRAPPRTRIFLPRRASSRRRARKARSRARATSATSPPIAGGGAALVVAAPRVSDWLRESLARSLRFDGAQALRDDAMTSQLLGWTTTLLWAVVPFGARHGGLRHRQRAGDGRLDLDLQAARPEVPRPRSALRPRPGFSKQQVIDALKASLLALVLGTHRRVLAVAPRRRAGRRAGAAAAGGDRRGGGDGGRGDGA